MNSQGTFFCVNKDLDLPAPAAIPESGASWRLWTLPKPLPRGSEENREPQGTALPGVSMAKTMDKLEKALQRQHLHYCPQHPAGSIALPGCRAVRRWMCCSETRKTTGLGAPSREPLGSITETTRRCPQAPLQPRSSRQSAPRSRCTLLRWELAADTCPGAHRGLSDKSPGQLRHWRGCTCRGRHRSGHRCPRCPSKGKAASWGTLKTQRGAQCQQPVLDPPVKPQSKTGTNGTSTPVCSTAQAERRQMENST